MALTDLGMAGIATGQSILNQGLGMINQDRQASLIALVSGFGVVILFMAIYYF